jgi:2-polyprenyl-3-methyl-5-hydroxy-6-metoxy-1,4-benzoquinol methylase
VHGRPRQRLGRAANLEPCPVGADRRKGFGVSTYLFDPAWQQERDRLGALEALFDSSSRRLLAALDLQEGMRCLEVGCGAGGIALWLAGQVGCSGHVLATDLDTRFIDGQGRANLDVLTHDVVTDRLADDAFDLIHARAVLEHIPARDDVLRAMVAALKPGGRLLLEDVDFGVPTASALAHYFSPGPGTAPVERIYLAVAALFGAVGADASYGRRLPTALVDAGLLNVGAEVHAPVVTGGTETWTRGTVEQLADRLIGTGLTSAADIELFFAMTAHPSTHYLPPLMVSAWGQRPQA